LAYNQSFQPYRQTLIRQGSTFVPVGDWEPITLHVDDTIDQFTSDKVDHLEKGIMHTRKIVIHKKKQNRIWIFVWDPVTPWKDCAGIDSIYDFSFKKQ
jgi:hypothetical protein